MNYMQNKYKTFHRLAKTSLYYRVKHKSFYRGHTMRILSVCLSVDLSVRLSVKRVDCDKTEEKSVQIFITYERTFSLVF